MTDIEVEKKYRRGKTHIAVKKRGWKKRKERKKGGRNDGDTYEGR